MDEWARFIGARFASRGADKELHKCLEVLRCGTAPGCDSVPVEAFHGSLEATNKLIRISVPPRVAHRTHPAGAREWHVCNASQQMATGRLQELQSNLPPVSLLQVDVCHHDCQTRRLMTTLEGHLPDTQAGFRPARDCRDNVCAPIWFIQMIFRDGMQAVITFIDYSSAFDNRDTNHKL